MAKSFKKVIASLLAVLMVVFAMPLTALANGGDYTADVRLQFSPVYTSSYFDYSEVLAADSMFDYTMLQEAPLTYDYKVQPDNITVSGSLKLEAAKTVPICESVEAEPLAEDRALTVGDYFAVSVVVDGVSNIFASQQFIQYSDNIEPAGLYSRSAARKNYVGLAGINDANGSKITTGGLKAVDAMSAAGLVAGVDDRTTMNASKIDTTNRVIKSMNSAQTGAKKISTAVTNTDVSFTDPDTGALGFDYSSKQRFIANTFIFKIVGDGDISFSVYDPDNTKTIAYGAMYWLDDGKNPSNANYNTYANYTTDDQECKGQNKVLFYGRNVNSGEGCGEAECQHTNTSIKNAVEATCGKPGYTGDTVCDDCGKTIATGTEIPATGKHTYTSQVVKDSTCTAAGQTKYTCSVCGDTYTADEPAAKGHTPAAAVRENETESTCKVAGTYDEVVYCSVCGDELSRETKTKELAAHTPAEAVRENETESTCKVAGTYDEVVYCSVCGDELSRETKTKELAAHTPGEATRENEVAPTKSEDGSYEEVVKCTVCGEELSRTKKTIAATGVNVTIANDFENYGDVTPGYGEKNYKYGSTVKLSATPVEGATFVGWSVNNKIVSTSANYSFTAYVDTTITPVFNDNAAADTITVVFLDMYKNVTAAYENISVADFQAAMATAIPAGTEYPGYTFTGWSMSDDAIKALTESATITANYDVRETEGYTVTAQGAKITVGGKTVDNVATGVAYDSKVTVKADNATAWKIDGAVVAYGDSYTFFVGSNVTVEPVFDTIENKEASVTIISTGLSGSSDYKVAFLATVNVPEGYTMIDRGFVYGKSATAAELTLDNVGKTIAASGAKVKSLSFGASNASDQYGLTYGVKAKNAPAVAVAYVTVKTADGTIKTVYSDASVYNY